MELESYGYFFTEETHKSLSSLSYEEITALRGLLDQITTYLGKGDIITITADSDREMSIAFDHKEDADESVYN
jgi:hypothetical protein